MTKTLADMTAEERANCVGMWADATHCALQGIIMGVFVDHARVLIPENVAEYYDEDEYIWVLNHVTPRFDLPRAWNPDGTPPKGEWEEGWCYTGGTPTGDFACLVETQDGTAYTSEETPTGDIRRFITEWENANV